MLGVFSGFSETKNGKNKDIFYFEGLQGLPWCCFHPLLGRWWCPLGAGGAGLEGLRLSLGVCSVPLSLPLVPLLRFLSCNSPILCPISHFKGVFSVVWGYYVGLYWLRALRRLWGFCVREWLGGFGACCVFCLSFCQIVLQIVLLLVLFCSCPALPAFLLFVLLSWLCGLVYWLGWGVCFLSLSDGFRYKKRGANLRPFMRCLLLY